MAAETILRALQMTDKRNDRGLEAWAMLVMAMVKDSEEMYKELKEWYLRALQQGTNLSMQPLVAHCHKGLSNSYLRVGNKEGAEIENKTALELYRSLGLTYWLESN